MDRIRSLREQRRWSQAELARRAAVTRQLVSAVEAGRHVPNVAAALRLASALGVTVETLFAEPVDEAQDVLGQAVRCGTPVVTGRVGDRLVSAPARWDRTSAELWGVADAVTGQSSLRWFPNASPAGLVVVGCDPILGIVAQLAGRGGQRVLPVHGSTGRSMAALEAGRAHGALVHGRPGDLREPAVPVLRWKVASWQVGLAFQASARPASLDDWPLRRPVVVQRDPGAGSQQALVRALRSLGAGADLPGPVGDGHLDVARRVVDGHGEAGVVMEAAAIALGLDFLALEEHQVEFWLARQWATLPAATVFLEVLGSDGLRQRARCLAGYDATDCGVEIHPAPRLDPPARSNRGRTTR
jgi:transcriptional regulator with XRE-family HTH domain/molybdate-binding protein